MWQLRDTVYNQEWLTIDHQEEDAKKMLDHQLNEDSLTIGKSPLEQRPGEPRIIDKEHCLYKNKIITQHLFDASLARLWK